MADIFKVIFEKDVPVIMRDGTKLRANIYRPQKTGKYPVLLARLPYSKDLPTFHAYFDPIKATQRGYIVVVQDCRGRFRSEGTWVPFVDEFQDGYDTVEWAATLPDSDGQVATWGLSYFGMTQLQAAIMNPPSLKGMVLGQTWGNYLTGVFWRGGARQLGSLRYWVQGVLALDSIIKKYQESDELPYKLQEYVSLIDNLKESFWVSPLDKSPDPSNVVPYMYEWLERKVTDPYWESLNIDNRYKEIHVPTFHIGGWYDIFLDGTLEQFIAMKEQANTTGIQNPRLIIGPWEHGKFGSLVGEEEFGMASSGSFLNYRGDLTDLHLKWYDAILKKDTPTIENEPPVQIFVMGENKWRNFEDWPAPGSHEEKWYFHSDGNANSRFGNGHLSRVKPELDEPYDTFYYDPQDPVPTIGGALLLPEVIRGGARDQRQNEDRQDVLCYTTDVLEKDYTVVGSVYVHLYAASSAFDTDFVARLVNVYPDGKAINVTDGIIRASARDSYSRSGSIQPVKSSLIVPDQIYEYIIDMWATGITFKAGHRIRVEITSSNFPRWDRNLNTGKDSFTSSESIVAVQTIFHNSKYPSSIILTAIHN